MAGRGPTSFQKRQKEQQRKEKQQAKLARRAQRKIEGLPEGTTDPEDDNPPLDTDVDIENIGPAGIDRQGASVG